jgi:hypothetical protein
MFRTRYFFISTFFLQNQTNSCIIPLKFLCSKHALKFLSEIIFFSDFLILFFFRFLTLHRRAKGVL